MGRSRVAFTRTREVSKYRSVGRLRRELRLLLRRGPFISTVITECSGLTTITLSITKEANEGIPSSLVIAKFSGSFVDGCMDPTLAAIRVRGRRITGSTVRTLLSLVHRSKISGGVDFATELVVERDAKGGYCYGRW